MIVTPLKPYTLPLTDASLRPMGTDRDPWWPHHGDLIRAMREAAGAKTTGIEGEDPALRPLLGFLWERVVGLLWMGVPYRDALESVWKEYMGTIHTGPADRGTEIETQLRLRYDGVAMTPDAFDPAGPRLESYKLTWISMRKWVEAPEEYFWSWLRAEMSYLLALSEREGTAILTVRFFIFWVNGDYSRKIGQGAQATYTDVSWTQEELESHWKMMRRWRDVVIAQKRTLR